jgi:hypothetical protein
MGTFSPGWTAMMCGRITSERLNIFWQYGQGVGRPRPVTTPSPFLFGSVLSLVLLFGDFFNVGLAVEVSGKFLIFSLPITFNGLF